MKIYVSPQIEVLTVQVEVEFNGSSNNDNGGTSIPGWEII